MHYIVFIIINYNMPKKTFAKSHASKRDEEAVKRELQEDLNKLRRETQQLEVI